MQELKNIYLIAWKYQKFFDRSDKPIGSILLPDQREEFSKIWANMKFGNFDTYEEAIEELGDFSGGIIKQSDPYKQILNSNQNSYFKEEFEILSDIRRATTMTSQKASNVTGEGDHEDLSGFRFYVLESRDDNEQTTVYHFARFMPKYHILKNKRLLHTQFETVDTIHSNASFSLDSVILIESSVFASAIYSENGLESNIQVFVHKPEEYEKAFVLKNSYFEYAKKTFEKFRSSDITVKRTISKQGISVNWDDEKFSPSVFFNEKNVNIAKKFARDSEDDKQYDIDRIVEANKKLENNVQKGNKPLKVHRSKEGKVVGLLVDESSVATLAAIMDGQIWTNEIHQETQTNI